MEGLDNDDGDDPHGSRSEEDKEQLDSRISFIFLVDEQQQQIGNQIGEKGIW